MKNIAHLRKKVMCFKERTEVVVRSVFEHDRSVEAKELRASHCDSA